jgi:hypothetical protein
MLFFITLLGSAQFEVNLITFVFASGVGWLNSGTLPCFSAAYELVSL